VKTECGTEVLLDISCPINVDNFGSQLKTIASKRTKEGRGKKQITKIWQFVSRGSVPKNLLPVEGFT
jgi:hypothetical protein